MHDVSDPDANAFSYAFGQNVREARMRKNWSQRELAEALNVRSVKLDPSAVTRIERGVRDVKLREALAIAECLDVDVQQLWSPIGRDPLSMALELRRLAEERMRSGRSAFREFGQHAQGLAGLLYVSRAARDGLGRLRGQSKELEPHELVVFELKDLLRELREWARDSEVEVEEGLDGVLQKVVNEAVEGLFIGDSSGRPAGRKRQAAKSKGDAEA